MAIIRPKANQAYEVTDNQLKRMAPTERQADDADLAWGDEAPGCGGLPTHSLYVLDKREWFDPHTSTKYYEGISRHAMYGPAVIHVSRAGHGISTTEYHVNDPTVWAWVGRSIKEGFLSPETLRSADDENEVTISTTSLPKRSKANHA